MTLEEFEAGFRAGIDAFNRRDLTTAFAGCAPDCRFHTAVLADEGVLIGPKAIARFFEEDLFALFPDWQVEPLHFREAGDGVFVVLLRGQGTGGASPAHTRVDLGDVWEVRGGALVSGREFTTWEQALEWAGLNPSVAAELRRAERAVSGGP